MSRLRCLVLALYFQKFTVSMVNAFFNSSLPQPPIEITIMVFGRTTSVGFNSLSISEPPCEVAVEHLAQQYNQSLHFKYESNNAHNCMATAMTGDDVLGKYFYPFQAQGRVVVLSTPGDPLGGRYFFAKNK